MGKAVRLSGFTCAQCGQLCVRDDTSGVVLCPDCGTPWEKPKPENPNENAHIEWQENTRDRIGGRLMGFTCQRCGADCIKDVGSSKYYCRECYLKQDEPSMGMKSNWKHEAFSAESIIPFSLGEKDATDALVRYLRRLDDLPADFFDSMELESAEAVYMPYWLFDDDTRFTAYFSGGTDSADAYYVGRMSFRYLPYQGFRQGWEWTIPAIEPYDFSKLAPRTADDARGYTVLPCEVDFNPEKHDMHMRMNIAVAKKNRDDDDLHFCSGLDVEFDESAFAVRCALLPAWRIEMRYRGETYRAWVNGQTGRVSARYPATPRPETLEYRYAAITALFVATVTCYYMNLLLPELVVVVALFAVNKILVHREFGGKNADKIETRQTPLPRGISDYVVHFESALRD